MSYVEIVAQVVRQHDKKHYCFVLTPKIRESLNIVRQYYDPENVIDIGYQRNLDGKRVRGIQDYIENGSFLPNAISLNVRNAEFLQEENVEGVDGIVKLKIKKGTPIYEFDGQHRDEGVIGLCKSDDNVVFEMPAILCQFDLCEERKEFLVANICSVNPESGLTKRLKSVVVASCEINSLPTKVRQNCQWEGNALTVCHYLNNKNEGAFFGNIFFGKMTLPNEKKEKGQFFKETTFVNHLVHVVKCKSFTDMESVAIAVSNWWQAITDGQMNITLQDISGYKLFSTASTRCLNKLLAAIITKINQHSTTIIIPTKQQFVAILNELDKEGSEIFNAEFWQQKGKCAIYFQGGNASGDTLYNTVFLPRLESLDIYSLIENDKKCA